MNHINRRSKTLSLEQLLPLGTTEILKGLVLDRLVIDVRAQLKIMRLRALHVAPLWRRKVRISQLSSAYPIR